MARILAASAVLVAVVAGRWSIRVTAHPVVGIVSLCLLVGCGRMAIDAGELRIVSRHLMAVGANGTMVRNREVGVVERGVQPVGGGVARVACRRVPGSNVVRDATTEGLRAVPLRNVASIADGVRRRQ